jgi:hypothetical protein
MIARSASAPGAEVIDAAAADVQGFRLSRDRQLVRAVDHRFALSNPPLVSAPSKKLITALSPFVE